MNESKKFFLVMVQSSSKKIISWTTSTLYFDARKITPTSLELGDKVQSLIQNFQEVFVVLKGLPPRRQIDHEIHLLPNAPLLNIGLFRQSIMECEEIKNEIQEILDQGVIKPSTSPCHLSFYLVSKKDRYWRMCIHYRVLNKFTIKNRYLLSRIDHLMDQLHGARYSKLDLRSENHEVRIKYEDIYKITFKIIEGLCKYLVLSIGLYNALPTFMRVMNNVLRPFIDSFIVIYLDDIII